MHISRRSRIRSTRLGTLLLTLLTLGVLASPWQGGLQAVAAPRGIVWQSEAEEGDINGSMMVQWDLTASACAYAYAPEREGAVNFVLSVPVDGEYYLWARVAGVEAYLNSFYVSFDGGSEIAYEIAQFGGAWGLWGWEQVHQKHEPVVPFVLSAGTHLLRFRPREARARLDRLILTDDPSFVPPEIIPCEESPLFYVMCLGDSITHGYPYANTELTYPRQLESMLAASHGPRRFWVMNRGIDGYRADQVLADLQQGNWLTGQIDWALLLVGGNDLAQEILPDGSNVEEVMQRTLSEIQGIVNLVRAHTNPDGSRPHVIVSALTPTTDFWQCLVLAAFNERLQRDLSGIDAFVSANWDDLYDPSRGRARAERMFDALHPNDGGYALLAENWLQAMNRFAAAVPIVRGWNLISLPLRPVSTEPSRALASLENSYDVVYAYDAHDPRDPWRRYVPAASAPPTSDLAAIDETMGLWIHATTAVSLTVRGWPSSVTQVPLAAGWNLVGYPWGQARQVSEALVGLNGPFDIVFGYIASDAVDPWCSHDPMAPPEVNDLHEMGPGKGYWIHVPQPCIWHTP